TFSDGSGNPQHHHHRPSPDAYRGPGHHRAFDNPPRHPTDTAVDTGGGGGGVDCGRLHSSYQMPPPPRPLSGQKRSYSSPGISALGNGGVEGWGTAAPATRIGNGRDAARPATQWEWGWSAEWGSSAGRDNLYDKNEMTRMGIPSFVMDQRESLLTPRPPLFNLFSHLVFSLTKFLLSSIANSRKR
ncbi:hypothetical protein HAX54_036198, partial [Datura stramonium]|nr:hypothetical protein [Datura stramonium]